ncbi:MAG: bifunctional UDP-N-acetylglucosamine diphosphorylase/glucosamine-1-phosphate N-acetyltransferase GlmU [Firmicutes bacterium]|nr:bifunctional UDP-N-acetylglucosamine diphosphorylase/glucosamine-1-phosphate N-acetyltransferase GlmU [Bacillota bacterium]
MKSFKTIILAAGEGTRMKSKKPKVFHELFHTPMICYVIKAAKDCNTEALCVVVGHKAEEVKKAIGNRDVTFTLQQQQLGTGHAVMQAIDFIEDDKNILILYGDTPLITKESLEELLLFHEKENNNVSIVSTVLENPAGYGHIIRDEKGNFLKNVEHKDASETEKQVKEINTGIYCFKGADLKKALSQLTNNNAQGEYYLPDTLEIILQYGGKVNALVTTDASAFFGVNSRAQLAQAIAIMQKRINKKHMENGVTILSPENTWIDPEAEIGQDTILYPNTIIEGNTVIGQDCTIGPNAKLTNMIIGDEVQLQYSVAMNSTIGNCANIGPFAYIRPDCNIGDGVKVGDFVEVKNSTVGNGTKIPHLTYVGDTDAGEKINFGCGSITVNYDGNKKHRTVVEDNVFVGCNANLVAPVTIKKGSYIAAGSTITRDVPEQVLAVARARQQTIEGWVKKH